MVDENGRIILEVGDDRIITAKASRTVSYNLKAFLGGPYPTFKSVPVATKDILWEKFKVKYSWQANEEQEVRRAWHTACNDRHRAIVAKAREVAWIKTGKRDDLTKWKGH